MTYKETVLCIGKLLRVSDSSLHRVEIRAAIEDGKIDWEKIVQLSTQHYVLPAIYGNLKRASLDQLLPDDLNAYMSHITQLNRGRNLEIAAQCEEIQDILKAQDITAIFLKGCGMILQKTFADPADRMIGDIDLLISEVDVHEATNILQNKGYEEIKTDQLSMPTERHLPRLVHANRIAALEIHCDVVRYPYARTYSGESLFERSFRESGKTFLHLNDQLILSAAASQINDYSYQKRSFNLKSMYDGYILREHGAELPVKIDPKLHKIIIEYVSFSDYILDYTDEDKVDIETSGYVKYMKRILSDDEYRNVERQKKEHKVFAVSRLLIFPRLVRSKAYRTWILKRFLAVFKRN